jgi:hypothetical protein
MLDKGGARRSDPLEDRREGALLAVTGGPFAGNWQTASGIDLAMNNAPAALLPDPKGRAEYYRARAGGGGAQARSVDQVGCREVEVPRDRGDLRHASLAGRGAGRRARARAPEGRRVILAVSHVCCAWGKSPLPVPGCQRATAGLRRPLVRPSFVESQAQAPLCIRCALPMMLASPPGLSRWQA